MNAREQLQQVAIGYSNTFRDRTRTLGGELDAAKLKVKEIEAHIAASDAAAGRLRGYRATIGDDLQCPQCWIAQGHQSDLSPQSSDHGDVDEFRCNQCGTEYALDA